MCLIQIIGFPADISARFIELATGHFGTGAKIEVAQGVTGQEPQIVISPDRPGLEGAPVFEATEALVQEFFAKNLVRG